QADDDADQGHPRDLVPGTRVVGDGIEGQHPVTVPSGPAPGKGGPWPPSGGGHGPGVGRGYGVRGQLTVGAGLLPVQLARKPTVALALGARAPFQLSGVIVYGLAV